MRLKGLKLDPFVFLLIAIVGLASIAPARGDAAAAMDKVAIIGVAALFFFHGAKLSTETIIGGIRAWRIHLTVVLATFVMFPLLGIATREIFSPWINPVIGAGIVLLCAMPSTVQSSIAFTAQAGGNVAAAVCSASLSSVLGVVLTPALAALLLASSHSAMSWDVVIKIVLQLLAPFLIGHACRPFLRPFLDRHKSLLSSLDRGVILLIVYNAFGAAVVEGLWTRYSLGDLAWTLALCALILAIALVATTMAARALGFSLEDKIAVVFCGSKKSLASGVPIASAIFPPVLVGPMILPLMLFHQLQLFACAVLAQHYAQMAQAHVKSEQ